MKNARSVPGTGQADAIELVLSWDRKIADLDGPFSEFEEARHAVIEAVKRNRQGYKPLRRAFDAHDRLVRLRRELAKVRLAALSMTMQGVPAGFRWQLAKLDRDAQWKLHLILQAQPSLLWMGLCWQLDRSEKATDKGLREVLNLKPAPYQAHSHRSGLWKVGEQMVKNPDTYYGKSLWYYKKAVANQASYDYIERDMEDNDKLGFTPRDPKSKTLPIKLRGRLNRGAPNSYKVNRSAFAPYVAELPASIEEDLKTVHQQEQLRELIPALISEEKEREYAIKTLVLGTRCVDALREVGREGDWSFHSNVRRKLQRRLASR